MERTWEYAVVLDAWTFRDCGNEKTGREFLDTLVKFGFVPKKFGDEDPPRHKYDPSSRDEILHEWVKHPGQLIIERLGQNGFQALLHLADPIKRPALITFAIHDQYFTNDEDTTRFLQFSEELYKIFGPFYMSISHRKDLDHKTIIITPIEVGGRTLYSEDHIPVNPVKGLPGIFWANFLGPEFVSFFSRTRIALAPSYKNKELPDGGHLILTSRSPLDYSKQDTKKIETELTDYLGREAIFDKSTPSRTLRTPFPTQSERALGVEVTKALEPDRKTPQKLDNCPECGEETKIRETSRDSLNQLIGFKCLRCGATWAVHTSLLKTK